MKQFEKDLNTLIALTKGGKKPVYQKTTGLSDEALFTLEKKGLVCLQHVGEAGTIITLPHAAMIYKSEKKEAQKKSVRDYILTNWIAFVALIISLVALIRTF